MSLKDLCIHTVPVPVIDPDSGEAAAVERILAVIAGTEEQALNERDELVAALREAEAVMMIVQPRSDTKAYLTALATIRAALATADACAARRGEG